MVEHKMPPYTIKHVDGVMHLILQPESEGKGITSPLRVLTPVIEADADQ